MNYKNVAISRVSDKFFKVGEVIPITGICKYGVIIRGNTSVGFNDPDFILMFNTTNNEIDKIANAIVDNKSMFIV